MSVFIGKQLFKHYFYSMRVLCTIILLLFATTIWAKELSADSKKAMAGYNAIVHDASLPDNQLYFIHCFPATKDKFIRTFGPNSYDQLYPQYVSYLEAYKKYGIMYPKPALLKAMDISKGLVWSGGPVAAMHDIVLTLAAQNPALFADSLATMRHKEQRAIIMFMADTINPEPFPAFQSLLDALVAINRNDLRDKLWIAYEEQKKYHSANHGK
jgi:hypothetical protein